MSPFSPRPLPFSLPGAIRISNYYPPLVTRCLRHATPSRPSTGLIACHRPFRSFTTTPHRHYKTIQEARSRYRSGVGLTSLHSFCCSPGHQLIRFSHPAVHYRRGGPLPSCRRMRDLLLPIRKGTIGAPTRSGAGKRSGQAESGRHFSTVGS